MGVHLSYHIHQLGLASRDVACKMRLAGPSGVKSEDVWGRAKIPRFQHCNGSRSPSLRYRMSAPFFASASGREPTFQISAELDPRPRHGICKYQLWLY